MKLDFTKLNFGQDVIGQFDEKDSYSPQKVVKNVFAITSQKKFEKGTSLENQRKYFRVMDKLEGEAELSEEQVDFMLEVLTTTDMPILKVLVQIIDWLEETKKAQQS